MLQQGTVAVCKDAGQIHLHPFHAVMIQDLSRSLDFLIMFLPVVDGQRNHVFLPELFNGKPQTGRAVHAAAE